MSGLGYPGGKVGQIVSHDFPIPVKIHYGFGVRMNSVVIASQLAPIVSLDPIRIRKRGPAWKKIAA
jgi:hypothetical protein